LQNISSGITSLTIQNNTNLGVCTLSSLCAYLSNPIGTHPRTITGNKTGGSCVSPAAVISSCNTCAVPTALAVTDITQNEATLTWTSSGDLFDIEWGTQGFTLGNGTSASSGQNSYTISNLSQNTQYQYYVRQNCGSIQSSWAGPFGFRTCSSGNVTLLTQEQVNAFGANCTTINGHLIIGHNNQTYTTTDITDLSPLAGITQVTGNVVIRRNHSLTTINLDALQTIGGTLTVNEENSLTSVSLANLETVAGISFTVPSLTSLTGLNELETVTGNMSFSGNFGMAFPTFDSLTSIGGNLTFSNITGLTSVTGFANLTSITNNFSVSSIAEVSGFNSLTSLGGIISQQNSNPLTKFEFLGTAPITITGNIHFETNAAGLNTFLSQGLNLRNVTSVGGFISLVNLGATSVTGFDNLNSVGKHLNFWSIPNLSGTLNLGNLTSVGAAGNANEKYVNFRNVGTSSITGLNLTEIGGYLQFNGTPNLTSVPGLENNLTSLGGYVNVQNTGFSSLSFLQNITTLPNYLHIRDNSSLTSLTALDGLTTINGYLTIRSNGNLNSLSGLETITSINGVLTIEQNNALISLSGLQNITSGITNLHIWNNANLEMCELANLCSYLSNPVGTHPRAIGLNKTGGNCVNEAAVIAVCTPPCDAPTALTASGVTISSANLGWTSDGTSFDLQWGTSGFELGDGIVVENLTTTSYSLSGLSYNTAYQFYVRQNCEDNQSDWAGPYAFSTPTFCPQGNYTLKTQAEIDGFLTTNPGCTAITGNLVIGHNNITYGNTNITDLSPLANITHITGNLIIRRNYNLTEINLPNLTEVGGNIMIWEENELTSINFLALTTVGGNINFTTIPKLETVSGFNNLTTVGGAVHFQQLRQTVVPTAPNTLSLPAFTSLQSIGGNLTFLNIFGLTSYANVFPNLQSLGGTLQLSNNNSANGTVTFTGFNNLTSIGAINVSTNQSALQTFEFLGNAPISVAGDVNFQTNNQSVSTLNLGNITSVGGNANFAKVMASQLTGFNPVTIGGNLQITDAVNLNTVSNFSNLTSIGGNLHFFYLLGLDSVSAFENLESVNGYIFIRMCHLTSLDGMQNIDASGITNLSIYQNQYLEVCELENFCTYLSDPNNPRTIFGNKIGGNCVNEAAIMAICIPPCYEPMGLSVSNLTANTATLSWNTTGNFELQWGTAGFTFGSVDIVSGNGNSYDLSGLNPSTQYEFYVRQSCSENNQSDWAGPFSFTTEGYCVPSPYVASQTNGIYINSFSTVLGVENIDNANSGFSSGGYGDFSSLSASQHIGESIQFTMTPGSDSNAQGIKIWADWNNDGVFETSEVVYTSPDATIGTQSGHFIVPNVAEGNYRMRVMIKYNSTTIDPCEATFYGEAEDYSFTVLPVSPCPSPTAVTASTIGINTAELNWNSVTNAQNYSWIVVTSGSNPTTTSVASGNTTGTSVTVSGLSMETAYDFYVKSDCDTTGQSNWSVPFSFTTQGSPYRFVKAVASGTGDGSSWANASADLQKMINGTGTVEVWVASGTYKPIRPADNLNVIDQENQDNAFVLKNNVKVYGGFAGTETELNQRDFTQNISILSGDFNNNGIVDNDDAYHVVVIAGNLGTATLDGFTVTGGNATGSGNIVVNSRNISRAHSGGINIVESPIALRNLTVTGNNGQYGGGIFLIESLASLKDSKITNNTSQSGAGIKFDNSAVVITNVVVTGNLAGTYGGGIDIYGTPSPTLTNVTISGNVAEEGGGICTNESSPIIRNSVIYGNNTGLVNLTPAYTVTYQNSLVEGVTDNSNGNIDGATDPMFTDMPDYNTAPFAGGDYTLQLCSPIINKGNNAHIAGTTSDIAGNPRIKVTVDLGAYEVQEGSAPVIDLYASGLHTTTVTLGWDSEGSLFDLEWGTAGFTQGSGTLVSGLTVNSYTLTNLTFDTTYEFYVREKCGGNQSEWSAPFAFTPVYSICPLGYLAFTSQAQIDAFGSTYSSCNVTTGHLIISGNDITNLSPLVNIIQVGGNFHVHNNPLLQNFNGLHNIKSVGGYIRIHNNTALTSIAALTLNEQTNGVLDSYLLIENNPVLTSLDGLESITEITGYLKIHSNPLLADMDALDGMTGIGTSTATTLTYRGVSVQGTAITALPDWGLITEIKQELNIADNPNLTSLQGLHNITSVVTYLRIHNNGLTNLDALSNLTSVGGNLTIHGAALTSVTGLSNLSGAINGHLRIENTALTSLNGLQGITAVIGNQVFIGYNPNLTDITALQDTDLDNITLLTVRNNASLAECGIFCDYLSNDPATHPRYFTSNSGNCANVSNVIASCPAPVVCPTGNLTFNTQAQLDQFKLDYPNCTEIAGHVLISGGLSVTDLDGLSNIQTINGGFTIWANHNLHSLAGLENLTAVASTFTIYNNTNLKNVDALSNLESVGVGLTAPMQSLAGAAHLIIQHNRDLEDLDGLSNLTKFGGNLTIENNLSLGNINGLASLSTGNMANSTPNVIKSISIRNNAALVNIDALDHLTKIGYLYVIGNGALENLDGLSNVETAVGSITIANNPALNDISGLGSLDINSIFGNAGGFNTGVGLVIIDNTALSVCNLPTNLCTYLAGPKQRTISGNLAPCADEQAAIASCQSCELPTNPILVSVTPYTAEFSWTAADGADDYNWIIITDNENPDTATPLFSGTTAGTTVTVLNLDSNTHYDFYVKTDCGGNESSWSSRVDFFTEIICPSGNVFLTTQAEVNAFPTTYIGCTIISGNLTIGGISSLSNITDLSPLNGITQVTGSLVIRNNGAGLLNLDGLDSITQVGGNVDVMSNTGLASLSGLEGLTATTGYLSVVNNSALTSLSGLQNITTVGDYLTVFGNHTLPNLNGLNNVTYAGNYLNVGYNLGLTSLSGLGSLTQLGGSLDIRHNGALTSLSGLNNLVTVGSDLRIWDNAILTNLNSLSTVTAINGYLHIQANPELSDITGLANINPATIGGVLGLYIVDNPQLSVCDLANFCTYLANPASVRTISNNGEDCTEADVITACTPVCDTPENVTATSVTTTSAGFSWSSADGANGYSWVVVASGANPDGTTVASGSVSGTTASVSGLAFATNYDFYVKTNCTAIHSDWSEALSFTTYSPDYETVPLTGFNADIIAEGSGNPGSFTTHNIDGWNNVFYNKTYSYNWVSPQNYLPANGAFVSEQTTGLPYQLAPANGNNTLRLTQGQSGTLTFVTPVSAKTVFALITSGGSSSMVTVTVHFEDGTNQQFTNRSVSDWFNGSNYAIKGIGRVERSGYYFQDLSDNPRIYEIELELSPENQSKNITGVHFQRVSSGTAVTGVMGISIEKGFPPAACPVSTTWNGGSWSNGLPDVNKKAIINGTLVLNADLTACELEVTENGILTIPANRSFTVKGKVINNAAAANFVVASDGMLIQLDDVENEGDITVLRNSTPMKRLDYTLWSSPVEGMLLKDFSEVSPSGGYGTLWNRVYTLGETAWEQVWATQDNYLADTSNTFEEAKGYLYRSRNDFPTTPTVFSGEFTGVPQNGAISINAPLLFNAIGNPYPSPVDANDFLAQNVGILYFWTNVNAPVEGNYVSNNWAYYGAGGIGGVGVADVENGGTKFTPEDDMLIQPGQGFIIGTEATTVQFNNAMRVTENGAFFKMMSNEKHRYWLNLSNEEVVFNQILVGYLENATQEVDTGIDAKMFTYEGNAIYSIIDNNEEKFVIQGRELPFTDTDVVKLGFRAVHPGSFSISLDNFDGDFESENLIIYLKDNFSQTQHNLKEGTYTFLSEEGVFENRFEVVYQTTLSTENPTPTNVDWIVYKLEEDFRVQTNGFEMKEVSVYDMLGRRVYTSQAEGQTHQIPNLGSEGVYIVKVTTTEDKVLNKKVR